MTASAFLRTCTFTHRDCLDDNVLQTRQPRLQTEPVPDWPSLRRSCDFCQTFAAVVSRCGACKRWLGLSDCACADHKCRQTSDLLVGGARFVVVNNSDGRIRCQWCAASELAPLPCGRSIGLLRRVVFVVEPKPSDTWRFHVAQRLLVALLENSELGTILLYSFECGAADWVRALRHINSFAADPLLYLPDGCRFDDAHGVPRISVVLSTHSFHRQSQSEPVRLEKSAGNARTLVWWLNCIDRNLFAPPGLLPTTAATAFAIDELFLLSCHLFPDGAVGAANARRMGALADKHDVDVMACDGGGIMMVQVRNEWPMVS
jgi:hypothetical protein